MTKVGFVGITVGAGDECAAPEAAAADEYNFETDLDVEG